MIKKYGWREFSFKKLLSEKEMREFKNLNLEFIQWHDQTIEGLLFEIRSTVLTEEMSNKIVSKSQTIPFEFPASWWQHFKLSYCNSWWLSWYVSRQPVRYSNQYREVTCYHNINPILLFPEQAYIPKQFGRAVRWVEIAEGEFRVYNQAADHRASGWSNRKTS